MSDIREKAIEGLKPGDAFSVSRTFSEQDVARFAEISRDYNPVHFDARFAKARHFNDNICHGLLVASMITEIGGQIGWLASGMNLSFKKPVYFNEIVKCDFKITDVDERGRATAEVVFTNDQNLIVAEAVLTGLLPGENERQIMRCMVDEGDPTNGLCR